MQLSFVLRFASLFNAVVQDGMTPVLFCDQDRTCSVVEKRTKTLYQRNLVLHPDMLDFVGEFKRKGGVYVPSSARSIDQLQAAYVDFPGLPMSGNDGFVIKPPGDYPKLFYGEKMPDYTQLRYEVPNFIKGMENVDWQEMEAYFQLLVDYDNPNRMECERFFQNMAALVEGRSRMLPMIVRFSPDCLSMEPFNNRGKDGAIKILMPMLGVKNPHIIVAGDGSNDIPALSYAKDLGADKATAIWVNKDGKQGCPEWATHAVDNVDECVALFKSLAHFMKE